MLLSGKDLPVLEWTNESRLQLAQPKDLLIYMKIVSTLSITFLIYSEMLIYMFGRKLYKN